MYQFVLLCLVIFFIVCLFHRLFNKPEPDVGVTGIDVSAGVLITVLAIFILATVLISVITANVSLSAIALNNAKGTNTSIIIGLIAKFVIMLVTIKFFSVQFIFGECQNNNRPLSKLIGQSIYNFGITYPTVIFFASIWIASLYFAGSKGIKINFSSQATTIFLTGIDNKFAILCFIISVTCISPVIEEIMFRGFMYRAIKQQSCRMVANVATALVFAYLHSNTLAFVALFVLSISLTKIYERSGDIREPILVHALFNLMSVFSVLSGLSSHGALH